MDVILVRHCESFHNVGLSHDLDSRLTDSGIAQALRLRHAIRAIPAIERFRLRVSPLQRCLQTAQIALGGLAPSAQVDLSLHESGFCFPAEGLRVANRCEDYPQFRWPDGQAFDLPHETVEAVVERVKAFTKVLLEPTVIVSHGSPLLAMYCLLRGREMPELHHWNNANFPNGALVHIRDGRIISSFAHNLSLTELDEVG